MLCGKCSVPPWCNSHYFSSEGHVLFSAVFVWRLCGIHTHFSPRVKDKPAKASVAAKDAAVRWHLSRKSLRAVCRSWFDSLGRQAWIMPWLGNGSRERLWDLHTSMAEDAQLSHPNSHNKASKKSLPALLCWAKSQCWFKTTGKSFDLVILCQQ